MGADIVINYSKDKASADEVVSNIKTMGARVIAVQADVSKVADIQRLFTEAKQAFGKIDIGVANAGIELVETPVTHFTEEQFDRVFSINTSALKHEYNSGGISVYPTIAKSIINIRLTKTAIVAIG